MGLNLKARPYCIRTGLQFSLSTGWQSVPRLEVSAGEIFFSAPLCR